MSDIAMDATRLLEMLPESEEHFAYELIKKEASVECVGRKIRYGQHLPERGASPS